MTQILGKKTKIELKDYAYKKDVENRLFLSSLVPFEVDLLEEILNNSLKIPLSDIATTFDIGKEKLISIIDKFATTGLLIRQNEAIFVDKEMRKYFEFHIEKFSDSFEPGLDYIQGLLKEVPINILPAWYNLPKTSDNLFASLIEKYFQTPKLYERHLRELVFSDPILDGILSDLYASPTLTLEISDLSKRYKLSRERLHEVILLLELHLACVLRYVKENKVIKTYLTPLSEWMHYLQFQTSSLPKPIKETKSIKKEGVEEFGFLKDLAKKMKGKEKGSALIQALPKSFLQLSLQDQSMCLYKAIVTMWSEENSTNIEFFERSLHEVERSLRRVIGLGWVSFDDFMKGFISHVGNLEPVTLKRMGTRWHYALPNYTEKEKQFVHQVIFELFYKTGITAIGTFKGKPCFTITPYGNVVLGE